MIGGCSGQNCIFDCGHNMFHRIVESQVLFWKLKNIFLNKQLIGRCTLGLLIVPKEYFEMDIVDAVFLMLHPENLLDHFSRGPLGEGAFNTRERLLLKHN